jgi:hypothetical protein
MPWTFPSRRLDHEEHWMTNRLRDEAMIMRGLPPGDRPIPHHQSLPWCTGFPLLMILEELSEHELLNSIISNIQEMRIA